MVVVTTAVMVMVVVVVMVWLDAGGACEAGPVGNGGLAGRCNGGLCGWPQHRLEHAPGGER